jgi:hypothetical protein
MSTGTVAVVIVAALIVIGLIISVVLTGRSRRLRQRFGPEYDRVVSEQDSRLHAEAELTERQRRVRKFDIQPLTEAARVRYLARWQVIQEQFVDVPDAAVTGAYALVTTVMKERGYPATDDDQAIADLSVDHASTVGHFRSAQQITGNVAHGNISTEDLRQALIHYRELFADLLSDPGEGATSRMTSRRPATASETVAASEPAAIDDNPDGRPVTTPDLEPGSASWHQER